MAALLKAVEERAQAILTLTSSNVLVRPTGKPPAFSGEEFWSIHPGEFTNDLDTGRRDTYSIRVTLTRRSGSYPDDRRGDELIAKATTGMYARVNLLIAGLHMDYLVLDYVGGTFGAGNWTGGKSYSLTTAVNGFVEPLMFMQCSEPQEVGASWFHSDEAEDVSGYAILIVFGDARRIQTVESDS
jgi:hypothetical protein